MLRKKADFFIPTGELEGFGHYELPIPSMSSQNGWIISNQNICSIFHQTRKKTGIAVIEMLNRFLLKVWQLESFRGFTLKGPEVVWDDERERRKFKSI